MDSPAPTDQGAPDQSQAAPAPGPQDQQGPGPIMQLIASIHGQMQQLLQAVSQAPQVPDDTKQELAELVSEFEDLVQNAVGGGSQAGQGNVSMEAGNKPASPAM